NAPRLRMQAGARQPAGPLRAGSVPGADAVTLAELLLAELGRHRIAEILHLEHLPDLDHRLLAGRVWNPLDPLDRLFLRLHVHQPEASDQLLGLGEGSIDDRALVPREVDACPLRARVESFTGQEDAGLDQL